MKKLLIFSSLLLAMSAAAQNPVLRNQYSTNTQGQPVLGRILLGSTGSIGADFQLRSTNTSTSVSFGDSVVEGRYRMFRNGAETRLEADTANTAVLSLNGDLGVNLRAEPSMNYLLFGTNGFTVGDFLGDYFMLINRFSGVSYLRATNTITLSAPTIIGTNNIVAQGALLGKVGLATNSAGATVDSLSGSLANFQTNQFTTNVPGNPVLGKVLLGSAGTLGADFQVRSTNTSVSVAFGDQVVEDRFRLQSLINNANTTVSIRATGTTRLNIDAGVSPGTGGIISFLAAQTLNTLSYSVNPLVIIDANGREFLKFNQNSGLEHLTSTNLITLNAPTVAITNNLNVGGTFNVNSMNVTQMVLVNLSNNYAYVSGNGTLTTTNNGVGWTNLQSGNIVSNGTLLTMTALGFDSPTNLWVANTSFGLGTNYTAVQAAGTVGITGLLNRSSNTERYGQLVMLATGTVIFTNGVGFKCNDGLASRTITNGNSATIAIDFVPGVVTNLFFVQTW